MITLDVELVAYPDRPLGACFNTEPAPLAQFPVDPNESLLQRSISLIETSNMNDYAQLHALSRTISVDVLLDSAR